MCSPLNTGLISYSTYVNVEISVIFAKRFIPTKHCLLALQRQIPALDLFFNGDKTVRLGQRRPAFKRYPERHQDPENTACLDELALSMKCLISIKENNYLPYPKQQCCNCAQCFLSIFLLFNIILCLVFSITGIKQLFISTFWADYYCHNQ